MPHSTEIVEVKKLSNGQVAAKIRCCGDASTDHWHTMAVQVASDPETRKASLDPQRQFVAEQHEHAIKAAEGLLGDVAADPIKHDI
jgi:hypothetical protein